VAGGDPINYTLSTTAETCSNVGTYPISVNLGANPNYDITTYGATLTVNQKDASVTADNKSKILGEANPVCGVSLNYSLSTTAETCSNVGDYDIAVNLGANPNYNVTTTDATLTIGKKAASVTANNLTKSYGDPNRPLTATVVGEVCSDLIDYSLSTTAETLSPVGTYPIVVTLGSNPNYTVTKKDGTLTILPRAATPTYTSFGWYSTKSPTDKTFSVLLSATVVATGGDIRTATVKFMEGSTTLCTGAVGLVTEGDLTTGVASCYWNGSLKDISTAEMHEVTVVVGGNYTGATDPTPVTISPAGIANFITGGGYLLLTNSGGTTPGEYGSKLNFGFTVKYNKSGSNPQGKITTILRAADGKHYQIKSTSITSLVVKPVNLTKKTTGTGLFTAKCVLKDLSTGLDVPGQYTMKLYMEDNGEPGGAKWGDDQLYLVIFNSAGGIWFSSNWTGTTTALQNIQNGNLQVH